MNIKLFYNNTRDKFMTGIEIHRGVYLCSYDAIKYSGQSFEEIFLKTMGWEEVGFYETY